MRHRYIAVAGLASAVALGCGADSDLNYASEYENEDDLINHCLLVPAIRQDMGL